MVVIDEKVATAEGINFSVQIDERRALTFQSHTAVEDDISKLHMLVDRWRIVSDRCVSLYEIKRLESIYFGQTKTLGKMKEALAFVDKKYAAERSGESASSRGVKRNQAHEDKIDQERFNAQASIDNCLKEMGITREMIELEQRYVDGLTISTAHSDSTSDS